MADPMKIRANVVGDSTEVKVLMNHEMETGQRKDAQGKIDSRVVHPERDGDVQRQDRCSPRSGDRRSSKNPFLSFKFKGGAKGDKVADHLDRQPRRQAHRRSDDRVDGRSKAAAHERPFVARPWRKSCIARAGRAAARVSARRARRRRCRAARRRRGYSTTDEIAKYRAALQDGNPAELWEARGEALWKEPRGPKKVSLEKCDLGLGPGVVKGAYAQLPRYFADADRVMDLETRLVWCMVDAAGHAPKPTRKKNPFGAATTRKSDMEALVAYVTSRVARRQDERRRSTHPKEQEAYRARREDVLLPRRPARFRVRDLPRRGRQAHPAAGPAEPDDQARGRAEGLHDVAGVSRVAGRAAHVPVAAVRLLPPAALSRARVRSDASIALTMFLARNANGARVRRAGDQALNGGIDAHLPRCSVVRSPPPAWRRLRDDADRRGSRAPRPPR